VAHKLLLMTSCRRTVCCLLVSAVGVAGCSDRPAAKNVDSAALDEGLPPVTGSTTATGWDSSAGPVMIVAASKNPTDAVIVLPVFPDSSLAATSRFELQGIANIPVELFNSRGLVGSSTLQVSSQASDATGCVNWPTGRLTGSVPLGWRVALQKGRAVGLPLDSLENMGPADSARVVADVVKVALSLSRNADPAFRGIPFFVRKGYRLTTGFSSILVAEAVRRINEEANPREEHLLMLAERSSNNSQYRPAFHTRSAGAEESLETSEILGVLRLMRTNRLAIVITFDYEEGGKIGLLERLGEHNWRLVWKSAYTGC